MIQHGRTGHVHAVTEPCAHPVGIIRPHGKQPELRVVPARIKMRRTIRIRKFHRGKSMWNNMVYPPDAHGVSNPFHHLQPFRPSVGPKSLADRVSPLARIQMGTGAGHLGKPPVIKLRIIIIEMRQEPAVPPAGIDIVDHINSRHIQPVHGPEIMTRPIAQPCMASVFLNHMPNQPHTVFPAPVSHLPDKILSEPPGYHVHIPISDIRRPLPAVKPKRRKQPDKVRKKASKRIPARRIPRKRFPATGLPGQFLKQRF